MSVSPFRIIHAIPHLRGAAGEYVVQVARAQQQRAPGSVAIVLSHDCEEPWTTSTALVDECRGAGVAVFWCGEFFRRDRDLLNAAADALRDLVLAGRLWPGDGVVHAHTAMAAVVGRKAGARRVVATLHGVGRHRPPEFELQDDLAWMSCDALMVPTPAGAARLGSQHGLGRVHVVPHLTEVDAVPHATHARHGRRIVHAGRLDAEGNVGPLIEAMPVVWQRVPDAELHVLGSGELTDTLRARAVDVDTRGGRIIVTSRDGEATPPSSDFNVFASASLVSQPDTESVFAVAGGLPVVTTRDSGLGELVDEARCGLVVPSDRPRDLGLALAVLLETSDEGRTALGADGRRFAIARFGIAAHLDRLQEIYRQPAATWRERTDAAIAAGDQSWTTPDGPLRLHLGSGDQRRPGWLNVDARLDAMPDLVARVDALPMVGDATVDEIEACHLFEHLSLHEAHNALREWARVLKPGGRLFLELPNFEACIRILGTAVDSLGHDFGMIGIYGWPPGIERDGDAMTHRWGWTPSTLTSALEAAGFAEIERLPVTQTYRPATRYDRDFRVAAVRADRVEIP